MHLAAAGDSDLLARQQEPIETEDAQTTPWIELVALLAIEAEVEQKTLLALGKTKAAAKR